MKKFIVFVLVVLAVVGGIIALVDSRRTARQESAAIEQANKRRAALRDEVTPILNKAQLALKNRDYKSALGQLQKVIDKGYDDGLVWYEYSLCYERVNGDDDNVEACYAKAYTLLKAQYPNDESTQLLEERQEDRKKLAESLSQLESLNFKNVRVTGSVLYATYTGSYWNFDQTCRSTASDVWKLLNKLPSIKSLRIHTVIPGEDHYGNKKVFDYGVLELAPDETSYIRKYQTDTNYAFGDATNFGFIILHYSDNGLPRRP